MPAMKPNLPIADEALPSVVYHYTSMDVLLKIAKDGEIWATNARFLNDINERDHFIELVAKQIKALRRTRDNPAISSIVQGFLDYSSYRPGFCDLPFIASFSAERDSLAQWRAYCPHGNGVCIGFRTDSLRTAEVLPARGHSLNELPVSIEPKCSFQKVSYVSRETRPRILSNIIKGEIAHTKQLVRENPWHTKISTEEELSLRFNDRIEQRAAAYKDLAFAAEAEYRLIVTAKDATEKVLRYRTARNFVIPYVMVALHDPEDFLNFDDRYGYTRSDRKIHYSPFFIQDVMIGPNPNGELSKEVLDTVFDGLSRSVSVSVSSIPYRDWL